MSRIGRLPVTIPSGVEVKIQGSEIKVKGPNGNMSRVFSSLIDIKQEGDQIIFSRNSDEPFHRAIHGTSRSLLQNMVTGVSEGFTKILEIQGVGYRVEASGSKAVLHVGFSHPVELDPPEGITFEVDTKTRQLKISGYDKQVVGQTAADIRKIRPPEPYKGKGIRYLGETVRRKAGKAAKAA